MANMRTAILFLNAVATVSAAHMSVVLLPTTKPTITRDPWQCATEDLMQYFDVPKPTGSLLTALMSYGNNLIKTCTATGTDVLACPFPDRSRWCAFTTAAPTPVLPAYSTYGSVVSSWLSVHSSKAVSLAQQCPNGWYNAMMDTPGGQAWLNETMVFAECYDLAHAGSGSQMTAAVAPTAASRARATSTGPKATGTTVSNRAPNRVQRTEGWVAVGTRLAAAAMNGM